MATPRGIVATPYAVQARVQYDDKRRPGTSPPDVAIETLAESEDDMDLKTRTGLARRIREVREDHYGPHGAQFLADALGLSLETWGNYERGVTAPAEVILRLIDGTGVSPRWLLTGAGPKYPGRDSRAH